MRLFDLFVATDKGRRGGAQCFKTVLGSARSEHLPHLHTPSEPLERNVAKVAILEQATC
jgi:hypothetical protein